MSVRGRHSLILWMVALVGPTSTTCLLICAIKRPSLVPPRGGQLRDQSGLVQNRFLNRVHQGTGGGEKRQAAGGPGEVEIKRMVSQQRLDPLLQ